MNEIRWIALFSLGALMALAASSAHSADVQSFDAWTEAIPPAQAKDILNNVAHEAVDCVMYFTLVVEGLRRKGGSENAADVYEEASQRLQKAALELQESDLAVARLKMARDSMMAKLKDRKSVV